METSVAINKRGYNLQKRVSLYFDKTKILI